MGRYTFFGVDPFQIVSCRGDHITLRRGHLARLDRRSSRTERPQTETGNIFDFLRRLGARYHSVTIPGLPPFTAGAVGYLSYEAVRMLERLPRARRRRMLTWTTPSSCTSRTCWPSTTCSIAFSDCQRPDRRRRREACAPSMTRRSAISSTWRACFAARSACHRPARRTGRCACAPT